MDRKADNRPSALEPVIQQRWKEPYIWEKSRPGARGHVVPSLDPGIEKATKSAADYVPDTMQRKEAPLLPELTEVEVMRHYFRLSQESTSTDSGFNAMGTCTMKYNPKINEVCASSPKMSELHPLQDTGTTQGILELMYRLGEAMKALSGMDAVSLQPPSGVTSEWTECLLIHQYFKHKGEIDQRRDLLVPHSSHGTNAVGAKNAGFNVISIPNTEDGFLDVEAVRAAVSENTAGMILTNPTSLSIFDPGVWEISDLVHEAGGVMAYDAANTNATMGKACARDLKFDIVHFNFHKAFSTPHGAYGPGSGVVLCTEDFAPFLPVPRVEKGEDGFVLNRDYPHSVGQIREFWGNVPHFVRAYAWICAMGAPGIRTVSEIATLNNNYLMKRIEGTPGIDIPLAEGHWRMEETVYGFGEIHEKTGITARKFASRLADFGSYSAFAVGYPAQIEEPFIVEPTESLDIDLLDRFVAMVKQVAQESLDDPETVLSGPHNTVTGTPDMSATTDPERQTMTWRMSRKRGLWY